MINFERLAQLTHLSPEELHRYLCEEYKLSYVAVLKWRKRRIPVERQLQIVKDFNLDPAILIRGDADDSVSQDPAE